MIYLSGQGADDQNAVAKRRVLHPLGFRATLCRRRRRPGRGRWRGHRRRRRRGSGGELQKVGSTVYQYQCIK